MELDRPIVPHKAELALRAVRRNGVKTFADLGGCWGVNGGYTYFILDNADIQHAYVVGRWPFDADRRETVPVGTS